MWSRECGNYEALNERRDRGKYAVGQNGQYMVQKRAVQLDANLKIECAL